MKVAKTLIIGMGTSGQNICEGIAKNLNSKYGDYKNVPWVGLRVLETAHKSDVLDKSDFIPLSVEPADFSDYVSGAVHVGSDFGWNEWGDPALLRNVGASINVGAGNIRMAGRLALFHNYAYVSGNITSELDRLAKLTPSDIQKKLGIKDNVEIMAGGVDAYVIGSLCGGTGSGCSTDMGYLLRIWGKNNVSPIAVFTIPTWSLQAQRLKKNAFIALTELNHYMLDDVSWKQRLPGFLNPALDQRRPYDIVYLTQPATAMPDEITKNEHTIASFLTAVCSETSHDIAAANIDGVNALAANRTLGYLKPSFSTFGISLLEYPGEHIARLCKERLLSRVYSSWTYSSLKDISGARQELLELGVKPICEQFTDKAVFDKYAEMLKTELESRQLEKERSNAIYNQISSMLNSIDSAVKEDQSINEKSDSWINGFIEGLETRFASISLKYLSSPSGGPGVLAAALRKAASDIESWSSSKGEIDKLVNSCRMNVETDKKNVKKQVEEFLKIKGLEIFVGPKRKAAWSDVVARMESCVKNFVKLAAAEKMKSFAVTSSSSGPSLQNKFNVFADRYISRLDNFEEALKSLRDHYDSSYRHALELVPPVNGRQIYKNNSASDEVDDIYTKIIENGNKNPNITFDRKELELVESILSLLRQEISSKLEGSLSPFDSKTVSDYSDYMPKDIHKAIEVKAGAYFSDFSPYRHIIHYIENNVSSEIKTLQEKSKPSLQVSSAPIPLKFQNDPAVGNISVTEYSYAFCPQTPNGFLAPQEAIEAVKKALGSRQLRKPVFDNKDPYRIMALQMCHGTSLAHINGILKINDSDMQALEDSMGCPDFNFWNTRKDTKWTNCLISKDSIDKIKQYWTVFRLLGHYKNENGEIIVTDTDGKCHPWYAITQGKVSVEILSGSSVVRKERVDLDFDGAISEIAANANLQKMMEATCQNRIKSYISHTGKKQTIEILFNCLENIDSYFMNISKENAEKYIIEYCCANGLETEYVNYKFPEDKPVDPTIFSQLYHMEGDFGKAGYYCPNGHRLGTDDIQATLRSMIRNRFICPACPSGEKYWPY